MVISVGEMPQRRSVLDEELSANECEPADQSDHQDEGSEPRPIQVGAHPATCDQAGNNARDQPAEQLELMGAEVAAGQKCDEADRGNRQDQ